MRTFHAIGLALIFFTITLAIFQPSAPALAQQQASSPTQPRELALRATEGAGATIFGNVCGSCHGIQGINDAMSQDMLKQLTPEKLYESMTTGTMRTHADAASLTDEQRVAIAEWVSGRRLGSTASGGAETMPNKCPTSPPVTNLSAPSWNGWSPDMTKNNRYQTAKAAGGLGPRESGATEDLRRHGFSPAAVARLELRWAFGLPWTSSAYGQPTVVDGRVFIGSDSGYLYSLDATTGCVHWSFQAQAGLRSTPTIAVVKRGAPQTAAFFGDIRGNAYAVDASTGTLLWKMRVDAHPLARITAGLTVHEGRVYIPVASLEEPESASFNYACCTIRGLVAVLDASTGKQIWKSYTIPEEPSERKNDAGIKFLGPSGAGIWGPVTIDPKRQAVYVSTGNAFSAPDLGRSNAVMAMDINTGKVLWVTQAMHGDVWHTGCAQGPSSAGHPPRSAHRRPGTPPPTPRGGGPARATACQLLLSRRDGQSGLGFLCRHDPRRPAGRRLARAGWPEIRWRVGAGSRQQRESGLVLGYQQRTDPLRWRSGRGASVLRDERSLWRVGCDPVEGWPGAVVRRYPATGVDGPAYRHQRSRERDARNCFQRWAGWDAARLLNLQWQTDLGIQHGERFRNGQRREGARRIHWFRRRHDCQWDGVCHVGIYRIPERSSGKRVAGLRSAARVGKRRYQSTVPRYLEFPKERSYGHHE